MIQIPTRPAAWLPPAQHPALGRLQQQATQSRERLFDLENNVQARSAQIPARHRERFDLQAQQIRSACEQNLQIRQTLENQRYRQPPADDHFGNEKLSLQLACDLPKVAAAIGATEVCAQAAAAQALNYVPIKRAKSYLMPWKIFKSRRQQSAAHLQITRDRAAATLVTHQVQQQLNAVETRLATAAPGEAARLLDTLRNQTEFQATEINIRLRGISAVAKVRAKSSAGVAELFSGPRQQSAAIAAKKDSALTALYKQHAEKLASVAEMLALPSHTYFMDAHTDAHQDHAADGIEVADQRSELIALELAHLENCELRMQEIKPAIPPRDTWRSPVHAGLNLQDSIRHSAAKRCFESDETSLTLSRQTLEAHRAQIEGKQRGLGDDSPVELAIDTLRLRAALLGNRRKTAWAMADAQATTNLVKLYSHSAEGQRAPSPVTTADEDRTFRDDAVTSCEHTRRDATTSVDALTGLLGRLDDLQDRSAATALESIIREVRSQAVGTIHDADQCEKRIEKKSQKKGRALSNLLWFDKARRSIEIREAHAKLVATNEHAAHLKTLQRELCDRVDALAEIVQLRIVELDRGTPVPAPASPSAILQQLGNGAPTSPLGFSQLQPPGDSSCGADNPAMAAASANLPTSVTAKGHSTISLLSCFGCFPNEGEVR